MYNRDKHFKKSHLNFDIFIPREFLEGMKIFNISFEVVNVLGKIAMYFRPNVFQK